MFHIGLNWIHLGFGPLVEQNKKFTDVTLSSKCSLSYQPIWKPSFYRLKQFHRRCFDVFDNYICWNVARTVCIKIQSLCQSRKWLNTLKGLSSICNKCWCVTQQNSLTHVEASWRSETAEIRHNRPAAWLILDLPLEAQNKLLLQTELKIKSSNHNKY